MDRIEKAIKYLDRGITNFQNFETLKMAKDGYFESVTNFKNLIIPDLERLSIFSNEQLTSLKESLDNVLLNRNKGGGDPQVYNPTWPKHGMVIAKLTELKAIASNIQLSCLENFIDFFRFNKKDLILILIGAILGGIITLIMTGLSE